MPFYANPVHAGTDAVVNLGDGYSLNLKWWQALPSIKSNKIVYNIYYSTIKKNVFSDGPKYVSIDDSLQANLIELTPGQMYFVAVRPVEYDPIQFDPSLLPTAYDNLRLYPQSLLRQDISETDLIIPLLDISEFISSGVIKVGFELIQYSSIDVLNENLILNNISQRGFNNSTASLHTTSGFDGYHFLSPTVIQNIIEESDTFDRIFACQVRFEYPNFPATLLDGYHQVTKDLLSTDLSGADAANVGFPAYDYSGYHRTDPVQLLNGTCVGSYIGGEQGCIDGYGNVQIFRGLSLQDQNTQRQDLLLSVTGKPAVLIKRVQTGITCSCYLASSEYQDDRCGFCFGTKFVLGYEQYFNPRRSDGRILVRTGPTEENLKMYDAGLESEFPQDIWTLTVPTIKTRDVLILFDQDNNEEFRYEVAGVTRNNTINGLDGGQHLKAIRIRKFDVAYQIKAFRDTSDFPNKLNTSIGFALNIPFHSHEITRNESDPSNWNQLTSISQGHNHITQWNSTSGTLKILEALGHSHNIVII